MCVHKASTHTSMNERSGGFDNKRADAAHTHREGNQMTDWEHIRAHKTSNEYPDDWPKGVRAISQRGLGLFGIKEPTGQLYWDGAQVRRATCFRSAPQSAGLLVLQRSVLSARSWSTSHVS